MIFKDIYIESQFAPTLDLGGGGGRTLKTYAPRYMNK